MTGNPRADIEARQILRDHQPVIDADHTGASCAMCGERFRTAVQFGEHQHDLIRAILAAHLAEENVTEGFIEDLWWSTTGDDWAVPRAVMVKFARALGVTVTKSPSSTQ